MQFAVLFDAVDAGLVRELQRDGRASHQALAERTGISREAARARVQRLVEGGRVRIVGIVAPQVAGMASLAWTGWASSCSCTRPATAASAPSWTRGARSSTSSASTRPTRPGSAYANFLEDRVGSLTVGKYADLVLLSQDVLAAGDPKALLDTRVDLSWVGGEELRT